jgi:hypothetical protein
MRRKEMGEQKFAFNELVLHRNRACHEEWGVSHYAYEDEDFIVMVGGLKYIKDNYEFLPYKGNEHLLGTKDAPKPKWTPKSGEVVRARDYETDEWLYRRFKEMTDSGLYECYCDGSSSMGTCLWKYCEPLTDEEKGNV